MCRTLLTNLLLATSVVGRSIQLPRDLATVNSAIEEIGLSNTRLRQSVSDLTVNDDASGNVVLSQSQIVEEAMRAAITQIQGTANLTPEEVAQLGQPLNTLTTSVATTMVELTAAKPQLDRLGTSPEIAGSLQGQRAAAGELGNALVAKLPAAQQAAATQELNKVVQPIDQAISAFGAAAPVAGQGGGQGGGQRLPAQVIGGQQQVPPQLIGGQQQVPPQLIGGQQQVPPQLIGGQQQVPSQLIGGQQQVPGAQQGALPPGTVVVVQQPQPGVPPAGIPNQPTVTQQQPILVNTAQGPVLVQPIVVQQPPTLVDFGNGQGPVLVQAPPVIVARPVPGQNVPGQVAPGQVIPGQVVPGQVLPPGQLMVPGQQVPPQPNLNGTVTSTSTSAVATTTTSASEGAATQTSEGATTTSSAARPAQTGKKAKNVPKRSLSGWGLAAF